MTRSDTAAALACLALALSPIFALPFVHRDRPTRPVVLRVAETDAGWIPAIYGNGRGQIPPFSPIYAP